MQQICVQVPGINGQGGQAGGHGESFRFNVGGPGERVECGIEVAVYGAGAGWDLVLDDAQCVELGRAVSQ